MPVVSRHTYPQTEETRNITKTKQTQTTSFKLAHKESGTCKNGEAMDTETNNCSNATPEDKYVVGPAPACILNADDSTVDAIS